MLTALRAGISSCAGLLALAAPVWADSSAPMLRQVTGGGVPDNLNVGVQTSSGLIWAPFGLVNKMTGAPTLLSTTREIYPTHAALVTALTTGLFNTQARTVSQQGYATAGDGGAADYDWNAVPPAATDNLFTLAPADGVGRFVLRIPAEGVHPEVAGAVGYTLGAGTIPDDTTALQALFNGLSALGGGTVIARQGRFYNHASTLELTHHVAFRCGGSPFGQANTGDQFNFINAGITHPGGTTYLLQDKGSSVRGCTIIRTSLPQQAATTQAVRTALTSTWQDGSMGLTVNGALVDDEDDAIIGFDTPLLSEGFPTGTFRHIASDGVNGFQIGGVHDTVTGENIFANNFWAGNLNGRIYAYNVNIASGGTGCATPSGAVAVSGGTLYTGTSPGGATTLALTMSGGVVTGATVANAGDYTTAPANSVSVTGLTCTTQPAFNLGAVTTAYRPGTSYNLSGDVYVPTFGALNGVPQAGSEGGYFQNIRDEGHQTGLYLSNHFQFTIIHPVMEPDPSAVTSGLQPIPILTANCASQDLIIDPYAQSGYINLALHQTTPAHGACPTNTQWPLASGATGDITISSGELGGTLAGQYDQIDIGPYSQGSIEGTKVYGTGGIKVAANAGVWYLCPKSYAPGSGTPASLLTSVDPTSQANINICAYGNYQGILSASLGGTGGTGAWSAYSPTLTFSGGTSVAAQGANSYTYQVIGKTLFYSAVVGITYSTAPTSVTIPLPAGYTANITTSLVTANTSAAIADAALIMGGQASIVLSGITGSSPYSASGQYVSVSGQINIQ